MGPRRLEFTLNRTHHTRTHTHTHTRRHGSKAEVTKDWEVFGEDFIGLSLLDLGIMMHISPSRRGYGAPG